MALGFACAWSMVIRLLALLSTVLCGCEALDFRDLSTSPLSAAAAGQFNRNQPTGPSIVPVPIPFPSPRPTLPIVVPSPSPSLRGLSLALRYVSYDYPGGSEATHWTEIQALETLERVNHIWKQCGIEFRIREYVSVNPFTANLPVPTSNYEELPRIRKTFLDRKNLLVVVTDDWNRQGSLGNTRANAWTVLPGSPLHGTVMENRIKDDAGILAHELGHYLSLDHDNDSSGLMSPVVHSYSTRLKEPQCQSARWAAKYFWSGTLGE